MSILRWICRRQRSTSTLMRSEFYSNQNRYYQGSVKPQDEVDLKNKYKEAIENDFPMGLQVKAYSTAGFRLSNEIFAHGPIILFPRTLFTWKIRAIQDITSDSLSMISLIEPKPDVLIIGVGKKEMTKDVSKRIIEITQQNKINVEILSTEMACNQFNHLSNMGRMVVAALIPPEHVKTADTVASCSDDNRLFTVENLSSADAKHALKKEKEIRDQLGGVFKSKK